MAVSLSDAWNETEIINEPVMLMKHPPQKAISTKQSIVVEKEDTDEPIEKVVQNIKEQDELQYTLLISHIHELRKEEARRSTVYIALCGILFAILLMYIERLQTNIKQLSSLIRRSQWMHRNAGELKSLPTEAFRWFH